MYDFDLDNIFKYHPPTEKQIEQYQSIREAAKNFVLVLIENSPHCPDQTVAVRKVREAVLITNAAIALDGKIYKEIN